jgi:uncharacterized membrane protein
MPATTSDRLVTEYLRTLNAALKGLPRQSRREVIGDVEQHIRDEQAALGPHNDTEMREVLRRLGDPMQIASEAHARLGTSRPPIGAMAVAALVLIGLSGLLTFDLFDLTWTAYTGWLLGLALLAFARSWTRPEKLIASAALITGTIILPAVSQLVSLQSTPACNIGDTSCPTQRSPLLEAVPAVAWGIVPIVTAIYLITRLRQRGTTRAARPSA